MEPYSTSNKTEMEAASVQDIDPEGAAPRMMIAQWLYRGRRDRPGVDDPRLFGEPAWDMLLDLYIHQAKGLSTSITGACIGSHAPATTALRYVELLCEQGWIQKIPDDSDKRRSFLALTADTTARLNSYFDQMLERLERIAPLLFGSVASEEPEASSVHAIVRKLRR